MKKLYSLLILGLFFCQYTVAQNPPVAVNDTFYVDFSDTALVRTFTRGIIVANDYDADGNALIIDTFSYNGVNQVTSSYYSAAHPLAWYKIINFKLTTQSNFFGKDSITYYLTDNGSPTGFDTAVIYIYVARKTYEYLDLNNVSALVHKDILFQSFTYTLSGFNVPKQNSLTDPYYSSIYGANLWMAGKHQDTIYNSSATFENGGTPLLNKRGNAGPIMNTSSYEQYSYEWDRVWKVSKADIQNHINGISTSEAITNWPAHGDTTKGQAYYLAPFIDVDLDGFYNPSLGDYPKIKGQQAVYFIRNDERDQAEIVRPMRSEIHGMVYAYDCPEDSAINHTVFLDYKIYNRSNRNYDSVYVGMWVDFDIGNSNDDFIACDVTRGTFYAFNGDSLDEDANGVSGYGTHIPAQGVTFLKGAKQANDGNDNPLTTDIPTALTQNGIPYEGLGIGFGDGITDNEYVGLSHFMHYNIGAVINGNGDPNGSDDSHYFNFLKGFWANGNQMEWGGDGNPLSTGGGTSTRYMSPGDSDPLFWSTQGVPVTPVPWFASSSSGDRRGLGSTGPFTLLAGESAEFELAFVFGRDYVNAGNTPGITVMQERVDSIRSYHANGFATTACGGSIIGLKDEIKENHGLVVYPNPFNHQFRISYQPTNKSMMEIYNLLGSKVFSQELTKQETVFDLTNKPNGIYFIRVTDGDKVLTKKIVKQ
jgi:hypothetical protein